MRKSTWYRTYLSCFKLISQTKTVSVLEIQQNYQKIHKMSQYIKRLTSVLLNGKKYHLQARQVNFGLMGRDKFEHIIGEKSKQKTKDPTQLIAEEKKRNFRIEKE